jgi:hypothetical protein
MILQVALFNVVQEQLPGTALHRLSLRAMLFEDRIPFSGSASYCKIYRVHLFLLAHHDPAAIDIKTFQNDVY